MNGKGFVVPPGGGPVLSMAPGRSAALKLVSGETAGSIMLFEETVPSGVGTNFHLHRDSDEDGAIDEMRHRHGLEIVGPPPF